MAIHRELIHIALGSFQACVQTDEMITRIEGISFDELERHLVIMYEVDLSLYRKSVELGQADLAFVAF